MLLMFTSIGENKKMVETKNVNEMREGITQLGLGHSNDRFYCNSKTKELFQLRPLSSQIC